MRIADRENHLRVDSDSEAVTTEQPRRSYPVGSDSACQAVSAANGSAAASTWDRLVGRGTAASWGNDMYVVKVDQPVDCFSEADHPWLFRELDEEDPRGIVGRRCSICGNEWWFQRIDRAG